MPRISYKDELYRLRLDPYITDGVLDNKRLEQENSELYNNFRKAYGNSIKKGADALGLKLMEETPAMLRQVTGDQVRRKEIINRLRKHADEIVSMIRDDDENEAVIEKDEFLKFLDRVIYIKNKGQAEQEIMASREETAVALHNGKRRR